MHEQRKYWKEDLIECLEEAKVFALSIHISIEDEAIKNLSPYGFNQEYNNLAIELKEMIRKLRSVP